jgi:hypothetical protein
VGEEVVGEGERGVFVAREQNYREYRQDQDGSGIGACKEITGYLNVLRKGNRPKPGQTVCAHGNPEPMLCEECKK